MAGKITWLEPQMVALDQMVQGTSANMKGAIKATETDINTIATTCTATSITLYTGGLTDWVASYKKVVAAVDELDLALQAFIARIRKAKADTESFARQ